MLRGIRRRIALLIWRWRSVSGRWLSRARRWITTWLRTIAVHCSRRTVIWLRRRAISLLLRSIWRSVLIRLTRSVRGSLRSLIIRARILIGVLSRITLLRRLLGITLRSSILLRTWGSWRSIYGRSLTRHHRPTITLRYWLALIKTRHWHSWLSIRSHLSPRTTRSTWTAWKPLRIHHSMLRTIGNRTLR